MKVYNPELRLALEYTNLATGAISSLACDMSFAESKTRENRLMESKQLLKEAITEYEDAVKYLILASKSLKKCQGSKIINQADYRALCSHYEHLMKSRRMLGRFIKTHKHSNMEEFGFTNEQLKLVLSKIEIISYQVILIAMDNEELHIYLKTFVSDVTLKTLDRIANKNQIEEF